MQLVHTLYNTARGGLITVASLMMIAGSFAPWAEAAVEDSCRNSQITSYAPASGADLGSLDMLEYQVSEDTDTDSLAVQINGDTYPVQYRSIEEGGYQAFVMFPEDITGSVYVEMHAASEDGDTCSDALTTSFVVDPHDEYSQYGVRTQTPYTAPVYTAPQETQTPTTDTATNDSEPAASSTDDDQDTQTDTDTDSETPATSTSATTSTSTSTTTSPEENATSTQNGFSQAASIFQALSGSDQTECTEGVSQWPWYVWLGIIWIWLVAMWLVVGYTVEPIYGNNRYARRLAITVGLGTLAMLVLWYLASSCHNQLWVPLVLAALGIALYWLYSEDSDHPIDHNN